MGAIISRWRKKPSTIEVLDKLEKEIDAIEKLKRGNLESQRKIIGSLLLYSVLTYILAATVFYFYYFPTEWPDRIKYSAPLLIFPLLIYALKRFLHWYFVKRITRNETALEDLREKKKTILEEVMEKETYKKAKEILERFDPERHKKLMNPDGTPVRPQSLEGQELRRRTKGGGGGSPQPGARVEAVTPAGPSVMNRTMPQQAASPPGQGVPRSVQRNGQHSFVAGTPGHPPPGPPMPRPVLPRDRSTTERLMELLIGDGPQNRYALICNECKSHNGMALKEEFEYLSYRCCYCYTFNSARKQKPQAPRIEKSFSLPAEERTQHAPDRTQHVPDRTQHAPDKTEHVPDVLDDSRLTDDEDSLISNDPEGEKPKVTGQGQGHTSARTGHKSDKKSQ